MIILGIIGAGRIGKVHLQNVRHFPNIRVKRVSDTFMNGDLSNQLQEKYGVEQTCIDAQDILDDKEINVVFICSPTDTHSDYSIKALEKEKHVFCEKPIDLEISKIKKVIQCQKNHKNLKYQIGFNRRFDHNFVALHKAISENKIGKPQMLRITSRDPLPPPVEYIHSSGGLFLDMMIHDFDMARFQTQSEVAEVYAMGSVLVDSAIADAGDIDSAVVSLKFKNGMLGYIENCRKASYGYDQRMEVLGDLGMVSIANDSPSSLQLATDDGMNFEKPLFFFLERYAQSFQSEQKQFFDAIINNTDVPCSVYDGLEAVRIAKAAQQSLKEGRVVKISEIEA